MQHCSKLVLLIYNTREIHTPREDGGTAGKPAQMPLAIAVEAAASESRLRLN